MYIRFVINELHPRSNQKLGIFHTIRYMADDDELSDEEFNTADNLMNWFADNMESPPDFAHYTSPIPLNNGLRPFHKALQSLQD